MVAVRNARLTRRRFLSACGRAATGALLTTAAANPGLAAGPQRETYAGMHDSAAWRQSALARIQQERKRDFTLGVVDAAGKAVTNATVDVELHRHAFGFGGALKLSRLFDDEYPAEVRERYRALAGQLFHKTVALNAFKWKHVDNNLEYIDEFLDWCQATELPVRGHTLVWPRFRRAPDHVADLADRPAELRAAIREHIRRMVTTYRGRIVEWDVLNEPFTEREYMKILGDGVAKEWFSATREDDPDAIRYVNDFGVLTRPTRQHQDYYFEFVDRLLEDGAPLQGIGFQAHNPARFALEPPENMLRTLDRFAGFGLDLQVTEFDVERTDRDLQARYTSDLMIAVFSHPATVGLLTWTPFEYGDNLVSKPDAAFYDKDLQPRPNGEVWNQLVNQYWRTREAGAMPGTGRFEFRGFPGQYNVRVAAGSAVHTTTARFLRQQDNVTVRLT